MNCGILTPERWERFLEDRMTAEESRVLRGHLASDCEACEVFFAGMDAAEEKRLRAVFDRMTSPPADAVPDRDAAFRAVMQQVRQTQDPPAWRRWVKVVWPERSFAPALAGVLGVLMVAVIATLLYRPSPAPIQTDKGPAVAVPSFHLEFAIGHREADGRLVVNRGVNGERYPGSETLFLRYTTGARGYVYLMGSRGNGKVSLLFPDEADYGMPQPAGQQDAVKSGDRMGIPLNGVRGRYTVIGVYSSKPLDLKRQLIPIMRSAHRPDGTVRPEWRTSIGDGIVIDGVYFDVQP